MRISTRCLALFYASLCSASTHAHLFPSGAHINQTIEELLDTTDADEFDFFKRLLERAAFDKPFQNATIFLPLSTPEPFEASAGRYLDDAQWELHARDIVNTIVYEGTVQSLGLFLASNLTMRNGEELQVSSTSFVQNGTVEFALENPSLRSLPPAKILVTDIAAANGVTIHITDALVPPSWGFSDLLTRVLTDATVTEAFPESLGTIILVGADLGNALTLLAPETAAFYALGDDFIAYYKDPNNLEELLELVKCHILTGVYPFSRAQDGDILTSLAGFKVTVRVDDNRTVFFNGAKFIKSMYFFGVDGIAYTVDEAILPPPRDSPTEQPLSPPTVPNNAPTTANSSNIHEEDASVNTEKTASDNNKGEGGLSGGAIAATVLGGTAAFLAVGLYAFWKTSSNKKTAPRAPVPMAAALTTRDDDEYEDPPTTIEPDIVEILPPVLSHSERVTSRPRVYYGDGVTACGNPEQNANNR